MAKGSPLDTTLSASAAWGVEQDFSGYQYPLSYDYLSLPNGFTAWTKSPSLSTFSYSDCSPTFDNFFRVQDIENINAGVSSPTALTQNHWDYPRNPISELDPCGNKDFEATPQAKTHPTEPSIKPSKKDDKSSSKVKTEYETESKSRTKSTSRTRPSTKPTKGRNIVNLRTASRSIKSLGTAQSPSSQDDKLPTNERRARHSHNLIEKQYRSRLNGQFQRLLALLQEDTSVKHELKNGEDKRLSKAEVLNLAQQHIHALEQERQQLQEKCKRLMEDMELMQLAVRRQILA